MNYYCCAGTGELGPSKAAQVKAQLLGFLLFGQASTVQVCAGLAEPHVFGPQSCRQVIAAHADPGMLLHLRVDKFELAEMLSQMPFLAEVQSDLNLFA